MKIFFPISVKAWLCLVVAVLFLSLPPSVATAQLQLNLQNLKGIVFLKLDSPIYYTGSGAAVINQQDHRIAPYKKDNSYFLPVGLLEQCFDLELLFDNGLYTLNNISFFLDENGLADKYISNWQHFPLETPIEYLLGQIFVPLEFLDLLDISFTSYETGEILLYNMSLSDLFIDAAFVIGQRNSEETVYNWNVEYEQKDLLLTISPIKESENITGDYYLTIRKTDFYGEIVENISVRPSAETMLYATENNTRAFHLLDDLGLERGEIYLISIAKAAAQTTAIIENFEIFVPKLKIDIDKGDIPGLYNYGLIYPIKGTEAAYPADSGLDINAPIGTPVYAMADSYINYSEYGHTPWKNPGDTAYSVSLTFVTPIEYNGKTITGAFHTHLSSLVYDIAPGSSPKTFVKQGEIIGYSGIANKSPHLHLEMYGLKGMKENQEFFNSYNGQKW